MTNTEQEQYKKESSDIKKRRNFFRKFKLKRQQNISNENKEISKLNLLIKQKNQLIDIIMKEINIEKQLENINKDVILEIYERMFEQVKVEINYLHNELTEVQKEIDIKDWNIDNSFQYEYVTRL